MHHVALMLGLIAFISVAAVVADRFFFVVERDGKRVLERRRRENAKEQCIECFDCKRPIERRADLYVLSRFGGNLLPLHRVCAAARGSAAEAALSGGQLNDASSFVRSLLILNSVIAALALLARLLLAPVEIGPLLAILAIGNGWWVALRSVAYVAFERRLP